MAIDRVRHSLTYSVEPLQGSRVRWVQTQGSPLRGQPWAVGFNSFGVWAAQA